MARKPCIHNPGALSIAASRLVEKANKESLLAAKMAQLKANLF